MLSDRVEMWRAPILLIGLVLLVAFTVGLKNLGVNPNNRVFFSATESRFADLLRFEEVFSTNTQVLFVLESEASLFSTPQLAAATRALVDKAWQLPYVTRIDSLESLPVGNSDGEEYWISNFLEAYCPLAKACLESGEKYLELPHIRNRLVDGSHTTVAIAVTFDFEVNDAEAVTKIFDASEVLVRSIENEFGSIDVAFTGAVPMMQAFLNATLADTSVLLPIVFFVLFILLLVFLGSISVVLTILAVAVGSVVGALGIAGWGGHSLNTATSTAPLVIFTLVVASSMHFFMHLVRDHDLNTNQRVKQALRVAFESNVRPIVLANATTIIGLMSMIFVSSPPIRQLALISSAGVLIGTALLIFVVPAAMSYRSRIRTSGLSVALQRLLNDYARRFDGGKFPSVGALLVFPLLAIGVFSVVFDEDFVNYFDANSSFRKDTESVGKRLYGPYRLEVIVDSGRPEGIFEPTFIREIELLVDQLRRDEVVVNVSSVADVLRDAARTIDGLDEISALSKAQIAQYFLSYELGLSYGQSTTDFVDIQRRIARISVLLKETSMADIRHLDRRIKAMAFDDFGPEQSVIVTGEGIPTAYLSVDSSREGAIGMVVSLVFSSSLFVVLFRSWRTSLVMLLATTTPVLCGFGVWGWLGEQMGMAAVLVVAVTIGVVIDDAIHLLYRFRSAVASQELSVAGAVAYSIHRTGTALVATSVALVLGYSVLLVSDFRMNSTFGICAALIVGLALAFNLLVTPHLMRWCGRDYSAMGLSEHTARSQ